MHARIVALPEGVTVHFFALHLGTSYFERRKQARQLISPGRILASPEFPSHRIIAGDFNEWTRGLATQLLSEHLQSADIAMHLKRGATYPGVAPFLHLDHIYYDRDFRTARYASISDQAVSHRFRSPAAGRDIHHNRLKIRAARARHVQQHA